MIGVLFPLLKKSYIDLPIGPEVMRQLGKEKVRFVSHPSNGPGKEFHSFTEFGSEDDPGSTAI